MIVILVARLLSCRAKTRTLRGDLGRKECEIKRYKARNKAKELPRNIMKREVRQNKAGNQAKYSGKSGNCRAKSGNRGAKRPKSQREIKARERGLNTHASLIPRAERYLSASFASRKALLRGLATEREGGKAVLSMAEGNEPGAVNESPSEFAGSASFLLSL